MKILIKYEFLKIFRKKSTLIVMAISLLLTAFLFGLPVIQYQTNTKDGVLTGSKGISYQKKLYSQISVPLTEEFIEDTISRYQKLFQNPDNIGTDGNAKFLIGDAYWDYVAPKEKLYSLIANNYDNPNEFTGLDNLPEIDLSNGAHFYKTRNEKINMLLNAPNRKLSKVQKKYWENMNSKISTPIKYGYHDGWEIILSCFELLMFPLLAICIVIAPVFSGEYQSGTDAVILSGKYGKTKLITAKLLASLLFGTLAFLTHILVAMAIPLFAFGIDGWNLPMQIGNTIIPYPYTFFEGTLLNIGVIYVLLIALISSTLFLSARMKSSYQVLIVLVPILFIPMFLTPNGTAGLYNLILFLLPYRATMPEFSKFITYQIGGCAFDVLTARIIIYAILSLIMLPLAKLTFKKHQVS